MPDRDSRAGDDRHDVWDAARYERFRAQRERPGLDLLERVPVAPGGVALDLGCGTGRLTLALHERTGAARTVGVDTSPRMLAEARAEPVEGLTFVEGDLRDLGTVAPDGADVIFSNAALQWVPEQAIVLADAVSHLRPGGTIAIQVPANFDHPSHVVADEVGRIFGLAPQHETIGALTPRRYAEVLHAAGIVDPDVVMRVYGHPMTRTDEVIDFVSGTLLTTAEAHLSPDDHEAFRAAYRRRLLDALGDPAGDAPYWFAFSRILASGRLPD